MKSFKGWIEPVNEALGDRAKNFEVDIVNLINYCVENNVNPKEGVFKIDITGSGSVDELVKTVQNVYDVVTPTEAKHSGDYYSNKSNYGSKGSNQDKADIIIISGSRWMPTSVKLSGTIVIASTQVKSEFRGIFMSAVERYEKKEGGKISKDIRDIIDKVEKTSIGEVYKRNKLTTGGIKSFRDKVGKAFDILNKKVSKTSIDNVVTSMENHIDESIEIPYEQVEKSIVTLKKELQVELNNNELLKQYIVFEGMTAYNKFNSDGGAPTDNSQFEGDLKPSTSAPYASYVLSPDGFENIKSPRSKYVVAATKISTPNIRTLPVGVPRGGKSAVKNATKLITGDQTLEQAFNELNKVAVNLKYDSDTKKIHKELQNMKNEEVLYEANFFSFIGDKLKKFFNKVRGFFITFFNRLKKKPVVEIIDGLDLSIDGKIKFPQ
jgi:hypothetical protein